MTSFTRRLRSTRWPRPGRRHPRRVALITALLVLSPAVAVAIPFDPTGAVPWNQTPRPAGTDPTCAQSYDYSPPSTRGAPITWGIGPQLSGDAGSTQSASTPENPRKRDAALRSLKPPGAPFVVRLNRMFEADGAHGIATFKALATEYSRLGLNVLLQVRYHPSASENGNLAVWLDYVRQVVDAFGPDRHVTALQITNEVNLTGSPNTSDGAYANAVQALVQGVVAAKREARRRHFRQLTIGFNYAGFAPSSEVSFFRQIGAAGGVTFRRSVDWVGVDLYPGTYSAAYVNGADALIENIASLRRCLMPQAGLGARLPIVLTELGYPTGPGRSTNDQLAAVWQFMEALEDYRGVYGISNVDWFDLRDNNSHGPAFQSYFGLLRDDYTPKPAFAAFRALVRRFA